VAAGALYFKMKPELAHREPIAIHEAGHFFAHTFFGHRVTEVEVSDNFGRCRLPAQDVDDPYGFIVAACAGKASTDKWFGWKTESDEAWKKSKDHRIAYTVALEVTGNHKCAALLMQWAEAQAESLVAQHQHWSQIQAIAHALIERGKLKVVKS